MLWRPGLLTVCLLATGSLRAVPRLQLDIGGGSYNTTTDTVVSAGEVFTLYALLTPQNSDAPSDVDKLLTSPWYISVALTPQVAVGGNLGSFAFNGTTVDATTDMVYGVPPLELFLPQDSEDLGQHGIFETYFWEHEFFFNPLLTTSTYNVEDDAGQGPQPGTGSYYVGFDVDKTLLDESYELHFDLYGKKGGKLSNLDLDVSKFAPFSHDAESGGNRVTPPPPPQVPEPATVALFGLGLTVLGALRRRRA
jgi:hypothetical protein